MAWTLLPFGYFLALVAGWVSHSVADMMTPSGVAWFWPARGRCLLPGNPRYRMEAMGKGELGFLAVQVRDVPGEEVTEPAALKTPPTMLQPFFYQWGWTLGAKPSRSWIETNQLRHVLVTVTQWWERGGPPK